MKFGVLGPLTVHDDAGQSVRITSVKQRLLLAALLASRNTRVSTDQLLDTLWDGRPPSSARKNVQAYVHRLRRLIGESRIVHDRSGYELIVKSDETDDAQFEQLVDQGRDALDNGNYSGASEVLGRALEMWRGPTAYGDVDQIGTIRVDAARLAELRQSVLELRIDADLNLGQHARLIPELTTLVTSYPLRQRLYAQLMLALHRSGRTADALAVYHQARTTMIDELGLEPGTELRDLEQAIIEGDSALDRPAHAEPAEPPPVEPAAPPAELPSTDPSFTGRHQELDRITAWLRATAQDAAAPRAIAINGPGGIGKSALALRATHAVAEQFPDGQLYVNLCGATPGLEPLDPYAALGRFLRSLGVEENKIPADTEGAATLFRSTIAGRRVLIVLDDAHNAAQVRPLMPGPRSGCAVLVTSRRVLATIGGAQHVSLRTLTHDDALDLLSRVAGPERVAAEPEAAAEIVRLCGHLPLAVRIAGARVAARPDWTLSALQVRLGNSQGRLDELEHDDLAVRASYDVAFDALPDSAVTLFAYLGLVDFHDLTASTAAEVAGRSTDEVLRDLDLLVEMQLVSATSNERFTLHDLIRLYAREQAASTFSEAERTTAIRRVTHHYLATARNAAQAGFSWSARRASVGPQPVELLSRGMPITGGASATAWIRDEVDNLAAAAQHAVGLPDEGPSVLAGLAVALHHPLRDQDRWNESITIDQLALEAADDIDDAWRAQIHCDLGEGLAQLHQLTEGRYHCQEALRIYRAVDDRSGEADVLGLLGFLFRQANQLDSAIEHHNQALAIHRDIGNTEGEALVLTDLGIVYHLAGRLDDAIAAHEQALNTHNNLRLRGITLSRLGRAHRDTGCFEHALNRLEQALAIFQSGSYSIDQALTHWLCGDVLRAMGRDGEARDHWRRSLDILCSIGTISREDASEVLRLPSPRAPKSLRLETGSSL
ncbi:AfsR/SARP family transcriptional regulator [Phytoactinopolyspora mesophila]|uniref:Tetratricopeptide repeat protein n=1 Tax=Phytoactinopolyspora mesophila TaxID=2650750 RepID=A0A7K3M683_9ACTN|nr:BTAD domain-containing putative transcriptional regulator [Phytoactinopolyspora mesophila]NDL58776.1 tetratricopeptide repeat protein [Phytoactinopolyspora mesophila]